MAKQNLETDAVEVVASWGGNPLQTTVWRGRRALSIGPGAEGWMTLPTEVLAKDHRLLEPADPGWVLNVPEGAEVVLGGGARVVPNAFGQRRVHLATGTRAEVRLGGFAFFVRPTVAESTAVGAGSSWRWTRWLAVAAVMHAVILGIFAMSPDDASALNVSALSDDTRYVQVSLAAMERSAPEPVTATPTGPQGGSQSDSAGSRGGGEATVATESSSPGPVRRHGRRSPSFAPSAENVSQLGTLAAMRSALASFGDGRSPYTAGSAEAGDGGVATAGLLALPAGPGAGALDLGGTGVGTCDPTQRDCTAGMVGVGDLDTHGDPGAGRVAGLRDRETRPVPRIRTPHADTMGALSREQVRRVIRRHVNEVRFCYEQALQSRPDLEGRVAVRFVVGQSGVVTSAAVDGASTTLRDGRVSSCVAQAVQRWTFPAAPGATGVTYPFVLQTR